MAAAIANLNILRGVTADAVVVHAATKIPECRKMFAGPEAGLGISSVGVTIQRRTPVARFRRFGSEPRELPMSLSVFQYLRC